MRFPALLVAALLAASAAAWYVSGLEQAPEPQPSAPAPAEPEPDPGGRVSLGNATLTPTASSAGIPRRLAELNRQAIEALEAGEHARAVALFEECLAGAPDEPVFARNLAEALARAAREDYADRSRFEAALAALARAVELDPTRADLSSLLERWRRQGEAEADFWTDESTHFQLSYDGGRTELLHRGQRAMLDTLEEAYRSFAELFGHHPVGPGRPKIQVVVYDRESFGRLTGLGHWAGGVYDGVVRVPVQDLGGELAELRRVLRHELVHAFVRALGGRDVPGWLNEGLAQWLEEPFDTDRDQRVQRTRRSLVAHAPFPLERLKGSLATWDDPAEIARAYAQSLALVDHVQRWYGERLLYEMVAGCAAGTAPAETFRARTHLELEAVQRDLFDSIESER